MARVREVGVFMAATRAWHARRFDADEETISIVVEAIEAGCDGHIDRLG